MTRRTMTTSHRGTSTVQTTTTTTATTVFTITTTITTMPFTMSMIQVMKMNTTTRTTTQVLMTTPMGNITGTLIPITTIMHILIVAVHTTGATLMILTEAILTRMIGTMGLLMKQGDPQISGQET